MPKGGLEDIEFCYGSRPQLGLVLDWILDFHAKYRNKKTFAAMSFDHVIGKDQLVGEDCFVFMCLPQVAKELVINYET